MPRNRLGLVVGTAALACAALSGCSDNPGISTAVATYTAGLPAGATIPAAPSGPREGSFATWAGAGQIYIVTFDSIGCPALPTSVKAHGAHQLIITTHEHLPH